MGEQMEGGAGERGRGRRKWVGGRWGGRGEGEGGGEGGADNSISIHPGPGGYQYIQPIAFIIAKEL